MNRTTLAELQALVDEFPCMQAAPPALGGKCLPTRRKRLPNRSGKGSGAHPRPQSALRSHGGYAPARTRREQRRQRGRRSKHTDGNRSHVDNDRPLLVRRQRGTGKEGKSRRPRRRLHGLPLSNRSTGRHALPHPAMQHHCRRGRKTTPRSRCSKRPNCTERSGSNPQPVAKTKSPVPPTNGSHPTRQKKASTPKVAIRRRSPISASNKDATSVLQKILTYLHLNNPKKSAYFADKIRFYS